MWKGTHQVLPYWRGGAVELREVDSGRRARRAYEGHNIIMQGATYKPARDASPCMHSQVRLADTCRPQVAASQA